MENEELDYLVNQKAAKLVSQCHLKEKEKFEKLQKKLEKANCINEVINPFKGDIYANDLNCYTLTNNYFRKKGNLKLFQDTKRN